MKIKMLHKLYNVRLHQFNVFFIEASLRLHTFSMGFMKLMQERCEITLPSNQSEIAHAKWNGTLN